MEVVVVYFKMLTEQLHRLFDTSHETFFIITNLIHKFLVHSHKLRKIKFLYMFRAQSAHHQEVNDANCTYAASGTSFSASDRLVQDGHLQRVTIPEAAYVQFASLTS